MTLMIIGWIGTLLYLANHAYISLQSRWQPPVYYGGNLAAALCLVVTSAALGSWQAVTINLFWAQISIIMLKGGSNRLKSFVVSRRWLDIPCAISLLCALASLFVAPDRTATLLGWSSAYIFCMAYFLFSAKRIAPQIYFLYNAYAATALLPQLKLDNNWPTFGLEISWATLSILAWIRKNWQAHLLD